MTNDTLLARFAREYQQYHRISPERARQQQKLLLEFARSLEGRALDTVVQEDFQGFAGDLMDRGYHVNTVRKKLNMIRPFFSWAYANSLITADQYMRLRMVENPRGSTGVSTPNPYTPDEVRQFWAELEAALPLTPRRGRGSQSLKRWIQGKSPFRVVASHAMRLQIEAIVRLALDCALRREEIYRLNLDDAHYDNAYVVVHGAQKGENFDQDTTRKAPFTALARKAMHDWIEFRALMGPSHNALWLACYGPTTNSNPMGEDRFNELLYKVLGERPNGEGWRLHRFRHTAATEWLRAGAPLETVSALMGHASLQQTRAYTLILGRDLEREMKKAEPQFSNQLRRAA